MTLECEAQFASKQESSVSRPRQAGWLRPGPALVGQLDITAPGLTQRAAQLKPQSKVCVQSYYWKTNRLGRKAKPRDMLTGETGH